MTEYTTMRQLILATIDKFKAAGRLGYVMTPTGAIVPAYRHQDGSSGCAIGIHLSASSAAAWDKEGEQYHTYTIDSLPKVSEVVAMEVRQVFNGIHPLDLRGMQREHDSVVLQMEFDIRPTRIGELDAETRKEIDTRYLNKFLGALVTMLKRYPE